MLALAEQERVAAVREAVNEQSRFVREAAAEKERLLKATQAEVRSQAREGCGEGGMRAAGTAGGGR